MKNPHTHPLADSARTPQLQLRQRLPLLAGLALAGACAWLAMAPALGQTASGTTGIDASGNYAQEVRACHANRTQQDRATCLREARNARADKQHGGLGSSQAPFEAHAMARCDVHTPENRAACQARMQGLGTQSGSVAGGGVLREVETVVPAPERRP